VAKRRKKTVEPVDQGDISFDFFKQEVDGDGVRVMTPLEVGDPTANRSGSYNLDYDLHIPFPAGRITEVFGEEGTCKTTLILEVLGRAIQAGKVALYVNMEKNLNLSLMRTVRTLRPYLDEAVTQMEEGVTGKCPLWIINATSGEQALEAMKKFASMVPNSVAALDSIDAAQPSSVLSGEIGERKVGDLARLMSDAMRKLIGVAEQNDVALVFVNQVRDKITMYGDPSTTPGGRAVKFYSSQRIRLKRPTAKQIITDVEGNRIGVIIPYKVVKNKVAPDGEEGTFPILFKNGIFREQELITRCCNFAVLRMGGKGGKQVFLPKVDRETGEFIMEKGERVESCMTQFNAARRLLMDSTLASKLDKELQQALQSGGHDPVDDLLDEIQDD
jgi:recombination protein RecA